MNPLIYWAVGLRNQIQPSFTTGQLASGGKAMSERKSEAAMKHITASSPSELFSVPGISASIRISDLKFSRIRLRFLPSFNA